jgi:hypothetical protein
LASPDFKTLRGSLRDTEREKLDDIFERQREVQREIIDQNVHRDREHLRLVNFAIGPFRYNGSLHTETGYLFIRVEPLYELGAKNFDVAIFNQSSKVMLLVECKSSVSDAEKEVDDVLRARETADAHASRLEDIVGDAINLKETVLCTNAAYASRLKNHITAKDFPICVWSADQATSILFLEKQGEDAVLEISRGRLHGDGKLTRMLLNGVRSEGIRSVAFLPSSHPCTTLEEIIPLLNLNLQTSGRDRFRLSDLANLMSKESSLSNFDESELWRLGQYLLKLGTEVQIFRDLTPAASDFAQKEFEISVRRGLVTTMTRDVRKKYTDFHSRRIAEEKSVPEFQKDISKVYKKLDEFAGA